ncbi:hypothetical protein WG899_15710 [Paucibacter sp. AS339]|uniref:hypothetical protein n=1 Tax=Paucibacter hankyongi TaxID=3133434 RepID=UPI00309D11B9
MKSTSRCLLIALRVCLGAGLVAQLGGCSVLYDIGQDSAKNQCEKLQSMSDRNACMKRNRDSYEDYEKRRQQLKQGESK